MLDLLMMRERVYQLTTLTWGEKLMDVEEWSLPVDHFDRFDHFDHFDYFDFEMSFLGRGRGEWLQL